MAVANYRAQHKCYPAAFLADENGKPMHSWRVLLLPFLEQQALYKRYDFSQPWNSPANSMLAGEMPSVYALRSEYTEGSTVTNYLAVVGPNTLWPGTKVRNESDVTDPRSSVISVVENVGQDVHWMEPRDLNVETMDFSVPSPAGLSSTYE
ncbi:MAG: DUF1559 domain-containing protein, partial [Pirellulaceae bacterium]|nr:DUF1559 domain-containing protein [Pirellulaceae bacterium]